MTLAEAIQGFLEHQRVDRGSSDNTVAAYRRDLTQFASTLPSPATRLNDISPSDLDRFFEGLDRERHKPASIARKMTAIRQLFRFCCLEAGLEHNPADHLRPPRPGKTLPKYLSVEQMRLLLDSAIQGLPYRRSSAGALQARDRAMIFLLYATGLRVSELVGLTLADIDLAEGYLRVRGKGGKERVVPFAPIAGECVLEYRDRHRGGLNSRTDHLFLNPRGFALTREGFCKILKQHATQAGIAPELISPHVLRHTFATQLLHSGMGLRSLQILLGHSDLATTQIYTHVTPEHLKTAHRKFHPRGE